MAVPPRSTVREGAVRNASKVRQEGVKARGVAYFAMVIDGPLWAVAETVIWNS